MLAVFVFEVRPQKPLQTNQLISDVVRLFKYVLNAPFCGQSGFVSKK